MATNMKKQFIAIEGIIFFSLLMGILGAARAEAVEQATLPSFTFRSTSLYSNQWTREIHFLRNMDDSQPATNTFADTSGPNRVKKDDPLLPPNPVPDPSDAGNVPLSDGLIELMIMAGGYTIAKQLTAGKPTGVGGSGSL